MENTDDTGRSTSSNLKYNNGMTWMDEIIQQRLDERLKHGTARRLLHSNVDRPYPTNTQSSETTTTTTTTKASNDTTTTTTTTTIGSSAASIDFSSNDYLGLARDMEQYHMVEHEMEHHVRQQQQQQQKPLQQEQLYSASPILGSTGSRLLSGDAKILHDVEDYLCRSHHAQSALLCNSGYDANLSVVSTLPCTCILYDSYIHNSLHMGIRLWQSQSTSSSSSITTTLPIQNISPSDEGSGHREKIVASFQHNNLSDLRRKLQYYSKRDCTIVILIESVYSMDGDIAPVRKILDLAGSYQSLVVVDEAHGFGVFGSSGMGVLAMSQCQNHPALAIAIYTFGKGAGCHGAVICSPHSKHMKDYWINYSYPIIYSTALPLHSIITIRCSYQTLTSDKGRQLRRHLYQLIHHFQSQVAQILERLMAPKSNVCSKPRNHPYRLLPSTSPIQALIIPGNMECTRFCQVLYRLSEQSIRLFPIKTPTVPIGQERIRIVLHAHNTMDQIDLLIRYLAQTLQELPYSNCRIQSAPLQYSKL